MMKYSLMLIDKWALVLTPFLAMAINNSYSQEAISEKENEFYRIIDVPIPEDIVLEVGGLAFDDSGNLGVTTRRGDLWLISNPNSSNPIYSRFAHGLHEPLGLAYKEGSFYLTQRAELTKVSDLNQDGKADSYETIYSWDLSGNYHEYNYGPLFKPDGNMLVTLNLSWIGKGSSLVKWRGWLLEISPEGEMKPIATGLRSPAGFGYNSAGDLFYTENQGDWVGSGRMTHLEEGDFAGNPEGLRWSDEPGSPVSLTMEDITDIKELTLYQYKDVYPEVKPPSVWFPHTIMGISTSDIEVIPEGFGPFTGQLLVGDQGHSKIMRVFQEKVNGVYQGVCFPFREGFSSGILRMEWGSDNSLYVGMTNRGWASTGTEPYGLQRLVWTKNSPFEIKAIRARPDGFELEFTHLLNNSLAVEPGSYQVTDFTYKYHHIYGSPAIDQQTKRIHKVEVSVDGTKARLFVDGMRQGYIYEIKAPAVKNQGGAKLLHNVGYYTLNNIPDGEKMHFATEETAKTAPTASSGGSTKRNTTMPESWTNGPDQTVTIGTLPGMKFDKTEIEVKAGAKIKLQLNNPDDMIHNLLVVNPGTADELASAAIELGLQGHQKGYVPDSDNVLYHTALLEPNTSDVIYFEAPLEPGEYQFVCTFPGHARSMRGILRVVGANL